MKKELTIDGRTLALNANAATPVRYRMTFGSDLITQLSGVTKETPGFEDIVTQMAYIMNRQAEGDVSALSFEDYLNWLEGFDDPMTFINVSSDIINFYLSNVKTGSKPKNAKGPRTAK